ncbi:DNA-directed RNA polymerase subunit L [Candidatus Woesearchaeota archaeon]|nr:DNA-directed RNA polymerase subunit L [Candidatus Woesearchaeota archaeon]
MELTVLEKTKKRLVFELKGSGHTLCNALKDELWQDKDVVAAAYNIDHPLIGIPKFIIETNGKQEPAKALTNAANRLKKRNKEFSDTFNKLKA